MTTAERIAKLQKCIEMLEEVDVLQQAARQTDSYTVHNDLYGIIETLDAEIEDEWNGCGVPRREANKNALTSITIPFGDFLAILQAGIKNINWTVKHMGMWRFRMRAFDNRVQFLSGKTHTVLG